MSNYSSLKATINANVKTNGNQEITGSVLNSVLNAMVDSEGAGYQFMGVATPTSPGSSQTPDYKCFYLAATPGTYTYLGGLVVADGEVAILKYDSSWHKEVTGAATASEVSQLGQQVVELGEQVESNTEAIQGIAATGGASVASAVIYANGKNGEQVAEELASGWHLVTTIADLRTALTLGKTNIVLDTNGSYLEVDAIINIPAHTTIRAYNGFIKRKAGYDGWLIQMREDVQLLGLTIDGNKDAVTSKSWSTCGEIKTNPVTGGTAGPNVKGDVIADCHIINGTDGVMFMGWHNAIMRCTFKDMASAAVHFSECYHSSVCQCSCINCCLEASAYGHSEGAILWSNWTSDTICEDNYISTSDQCAFGAIDSADNNNIVLRNNWIYGTRGIRATFAKGNAPYNVEIEGNVLIDPIFTSVSSLNGISMMPIGGISTEAYCDRLKVKNNTIINGGINISGNNCEVSDNFMVMYKYGVTYAIMFRLWDSKVTGNTFVDGYLTSSSPQGYCRLMLHNTFFANNKIAFAARPFYLDGCTNTIFRDNFFQAFTAYGYGNLTTNKKVDIFGNTFVKAQHGGNPLLIADGSCVKNNTFITPKGYAANHVKIDATAKDIIFKDNRYYSSLDLQGTTENGCYIDENYLLSDVSELVASGVLSLTNITAAQFGSSTMLLIGGIAMLKLIPASGYTLPSSITITYDDNGTSKTMAAGTWENIRTNDGKTLPWESQNDYFYDSTNGYVYIPRVRKGMVITASGQSA